MKSYSPITNHIIKYKINYLRIRRHSNIDGTQFCLATTTGINFLHNIDKKKSIEGKQVRRPTKYGKFKIENCKERQKKRLALGGYTVKASNRFQYTKVKLFIN